MPSFPRTPYLAGSSVRAADDLILSPAQSAPFLARTARVQEKLDGFNVGVWASGRALRLCDMDGPLTGDEHPALLDVKIWVETRRAALLSTLGERYVLYLEVLHLRHSVSYRQLPDLAVGIDVLDRASGRFLSAARCRAVTAGLELTWAPALKPPEARQSGRSAFGDLPREGAVFKLERGGFVVARAKWVRPGFELAPHPAQWATPRFNPLPSVRLARPAARSPGRRLPIENGHLLAERGTATLVRTGGSRTWASLLRALPVWHASGAAVELREADRHPIGPVERAMVSMTARPRRAWHMAAPALAALFQRHCVPGAQGRWVSEDDVPDAPTAQLRLEAVLDRLDDRLPSQTVIALARACEALWDTRPAGLDDFREHLVVLEWQHVWVSGTRLLYAPGAWLGDPADSMGRLLHAARADAAFTRALLRGNAARFVERALFWQRLAQLEARVPGPFEGAGASRPRSGASAATATRSRATRDVVAEIVASRVLPGSLPPLGSAVRAVLTVGPPDGSVLPTAPTVTWRRAGQVLRLTASAQSGARHLQAAWRLGRVALSLVTRRGNPGWLRPALERAVTALRPLKTVVICWPEGALCHLREQWLADLGYDRARLHHVYAQVQIDRLRGGTNRMFLIERDRLRAMGVAHADLVELDRRWPTRVRRAGGLRAIDVDAPVPHTLLNYPWGRDTAYWLTRALASAGVTRLALVGACGLVGGSGDTEQLVLPTRFDAADARPELVTSSLRLAGARRGPVFDVDSVLFENTGLFERLERQGCLAVEMEGHGFARAARETGVHFDCALFVTDVLRRGKDYFFDQDARAAVYRRPVRARNLCLDAVWRELGRPATSSAPNRRPGAGRRRQRPG